MARLVASRGSRCRAAADHGRLRRRRSGTRRTRPGSRRPAGQPRFGQPRSDGFRHLVALARAGEVNPDVVAAGVLVPPTTDRWGPVLDRAADGWWGRLMNAIRSHARGDLEEAQLGYLRSDQLSSTPWAARGLAVLAAAPGRSRERRGHCTPAPSARRRPACRYWSRPPISCWPRVDPRLPGDDRRGAASSLLGTAEWSCSGYAPCWLIGQTDAARALLAAGIEVPDLREGRRWANCGAGVRRPAAAVPLRLPNAARSRS
jgi:hypothetical protein